MVVALIRERDGGYAAWFPGCAAAKGILTFIPNAAEALSYLPGAERA
jgi:hypothetical protein